MITKIFAIVALVFSVSSVSAEEYIFSSTPTQDNPALAEMLTTDACHVEMGEPVGCDLFEVDETCTVNDEGTRYMCNFADFREGVTHNLSSYSGGYMCPFKDDLDFFACWREGYGLMANIERLLETGKASAKIEAIIALDLMDKDARRFMARRFDGKAEEKRMMFFNTYFALKDKVNGTREYRSFNEMQRSFGIF